MITRELTPRIRYLLALSRIVDRFWHPGYGIVFAVPSSSPGARMPTLTIEYHTDAERLIIEQAIAYTTGLQRLALAAPQGTVLAACEQLALADGRKLLRDSLTAAVQARADDTDAKKKFPVPAPKDDTNAIS
jgi:hypothetical protein